MVGCCCLESSNRCFSLCLSPESTAGTEAEEEAPGAADGSVQRGQPGTDAQDEAFGGAGSTGGILSQQQQQHHLSWYRMTPPAAVFAQSPGVVLILCS